jgi:DNA-binding SARP family transcriptional activator
VEFRVLGAVEILVGGRAVDAGHPRQRAVLAVLLLEAGRVVPAESIIDRVWGEEPPASVRNVLYGYVAKLRAVLAAGADPRVKLGRSTGGYRLQAEEGQLDLHCFRRLVAAAANAGADDDRSAARLLQDAMALWQGPTLAGVDSPWLSAMRDTLDAERASVLLDLNDLRLRLGQHRALVSDLVKQAKLSPTDERLIGQLMVTLYRCGHQADALRWFEWTRRRLSDEFGVNPGPGLRVLHQRVLRTDPALAPPVPLSSPAAPEEVGSGTERAASSRVPPLRNRHLSDRLSALLPESRALIEAVAVLGGCQLTTAAKLAQLTDSVPALDEAVAAGVLMAQPGIAGTAVAFADRPAQRAVYASLRPAHRRELHLRAANLTGHGEAMAHLAAATTGPDEELAKKLEAAAFDAGHQGQPARAAAWLSLAAELSADPQAADRRRLDALEILVDFGDLAEAETLAVRLRAAPPSARRSLLLGTIHFLAGRMAPAEEHLADAWRMGAAEGEYAATSVSGEARARCAAAIRLAILCSSAGRIRESIEWGERAVVAAPTTAWHHSAVGTLAIGLCRDGRRPEALQRLALFPDCPADVPQADTDTLVLRGIARSIAEDVPGAMGDLSVGAARVRAGVPLRTASWCLLSLAGAEYRSGLWDDAVLDSEHAVAIASNTQRPRELAFVHSLAAVIPAMRGQWTTAAAHVRLAREAAHANGDIATIGAASAAQQYLAMARGDLDGVLASAAAIRAASNTEFYWLADCYDWRVLEVEALIQLDCLKQAQKYLAAVEADLPSFGPPTARATAARLRAELALAAGHPATATIAINQAWRHLGDLQPPLLRAQLEITDARRLHALGERAFAAARLNSAVRRLSRLGATPYLHALAPDTLADRLTCATTVSGRGGGRCSWSSRRCSGRPQWQ